MKQKKRTFLVTCACVAAACSFSGCSSTTPDNGKDSASSMPDSTQAESVDSGAISGTYTVNTASGEAADAVQISDTLYGLFLEDINFAVDGGLYAELIKNRSFEYGSLAASEHLHGWSISNSDTVTFTVTDGSTDNSCLNENNCNYAVISNSSAEYEGIANKGFLSGLAVTEGTPYSCSVYLKPDASASPEKVRVALELEDGTVLAEDFITISNNDWQKYNLTLTPNATANKNLLFCLETASGTICADMVSLMPESTWNGLGIRQDIGEYLESLNPRFLRFPGGCVIEGRDEESMYNWKDSIGNGLTFSVQSSSGDGSNAETLTLTGDIASRPQGKSIWNGNKTDPYYTTYGIGFYEYFQICEALDCIPLPVLNAGMTCEVQSPEYIVYSISSEEFQQCVQDALDLVEFCRGGSDTYWGAIRIAMGHEEPFSLKYIGIGNEQWQKEYHNHYQKFVEAFENAAKENPDLYGDIELIVANGTASGSHEGWDYLEINPDSVTTLVDEHYYETPNWFLTHTTRYDSYDRSAQAQVFLGEYAAQSNTLEAALAEAAYMTGLERNSDIVKMACYAPLFGNSKTNQWTPDMMFYSNDSIYGTINYYVQKLFSENLGTTLLTSELTVEESNDSDSLKGGIGLGTWMTSASFDNLKIVSNDSGEVLYENDFETDSSLKDDGWNLYEGDWTIKDGELIQSNTNEPADANTGDSIYYVADKNWSNYTMTVDAKVLNGGEGFLIPVCVKGPENNIFWNIGGWGNTVSCLQIVSGGTKSGQVTGTVKNLTLQKGQVYQLKVEVDGSSIRCYIDDKLYVDYTYETSEALYETASIDANGDLILKLVNVTEQTIALETSLPDTDMTKYETEAIVTTLTGDSLSLVNSFDEPEKVVPTESTLKIDNTFTYELPGYSVTIIRIPAK